MRNVNHRRQTGTAARLAGAAAVAWALLASPGAAAAQPFPSRAVTAAEVEQETGLAVGGPDCAHAENMAVRGTGQSLPSIDTCGYYLGGTTMFDSPGVATVMRVATADPRALLPEVLPGAAPAAVDGLGDWAYWRAEPKGPGTLRLALVIGSGSELIATEIYWSRDPRDERATLDAAIALARRTISPAAP